MINKEFKEIENCPKKMKQFGGIPEGWQSLPLSQCIDLVIDYRGKTPKKLGGDWNGTGYRALSAKNIKTGRLVENTSIRHIGEDLYKLWMKNEIHRGDILLTSEGPLGESMYWDSDEKIVLSQRLFAIRTNSNILDSEYFYQFTRTGHYQDELASRATGTTVSGIRQTELLKTRVILPSLPEQRAIAKILSDLDAKIDFNHKMNETLEQMARAIFKKWFVDFEFPGYEKAKFIDGLPEGWRLGTLGEIANNPRRGIDPERIAISTPYIGLEHMPRRCISLSDWGFADDLESNKFEFRRGEILFGKLRPYFHKVGIAPLDGVCSTDILVVAPEDPKWFGLVLTHLISDDFVSYATATSTGTKMPRTNWQDMVRYEIALPSQNIAMDFNVKIESLINKIIANTHESRVLSGIRDTLLPKLMSGEIRIK